MNLISVDKHRQVNADNIVFFKTGIDRLINLHYIGSCVFFADGNSIVVNEKYVKNIITLSNMVPTSKDEYDRTTYINTNYINFIIYEKDESDNKNYIMVFLNIDRENRWTSQYYISKENEEEFVKKTGFKIPKRRIK